MSTNEDLVRIRCTFDEDFSYLGERSINYPDAGAMAIGIIFNGIVETEASVW